MIFTLFISCNREYINFEEFLANNTFISEEMQYRDIMEYKARIIFAEDGTYFNVYDNPNENTKIFEIKYWVKIIPVEIMTTDGNLWVKIKTKDNRLGWIKGNYIELYK
jgi:hypothetical protein